MWNNYCVHLFMVYCLASQSHVSSRWAEITGIWGGGTEKSLVHSKLFKRMCWRFFFFWPIFSSHVFRQDDYNVKGNKKRKRRKWKRRKRTRNNCLKGNRPSFQIQYSTWSEKTKDKCIAEWDLCKSCVGRAQWSCLLIWAIYDYHANTFCFNYSEQYFPP